LVGSTPRTKTDCAKLLTSLKENTAILITGEYFAMCVVALCLAAMQTKRWIGAVRKCNRLPTFRAQTTARRARRPAYNAIFKRHNLRIEYQSPTDPWRHRTVEPVARVGRHRRSAANRSTDEAAPSEALTANCRTVPFIAASNGPIE